MHSVTIFLLWIAIDYGSVDGKMYNRMPDLFHYDDYDKCLDYNSHNNPTYCSITIQLFPDNSENTSTIWNTIQRVSSNHLNYRHDRLRHGVCVSALCSNNSQNRSDCLTKYYKTKYKNLGLVGEVVTFRCEGKDSKYEVGISDLILRMLAGVYVAFVFGASIWVNYQSRNMKDSKTLTSNKTLTHQILSTFLLCDNISSIFSSKTRNTDYMHFLQTIRFLISVIIIIGHTLCFAKITPILNYRQPEKNTDYLYHSVLPQGRLVVSTFFVISSWLISINFFKKLKVDGHVRVKYVVKAIVKRYIRFTSGLLVIIVLHSSWLPHIYSGPFWEPIVGQEYRMCRTRWWTNLLYFNNFIITGGVCLIHTWYLSVDFQLTVLGLFILWLIQKKPKVLFLVSGLLVAFHIIFMFLYLGLNNFKFTIPLTPELIYCFKILFEKEFQATWTTTCSNLAPLGFGLCCGYFYTHHAKQKQTIKKIYKFLWCILTTALSIGTPLFSSYLMTTEYYSNSRWFNAAYGSIDKILFDLGAALLIFGMSQNLGGIIKKCFEWTPIDALGQLSFGAYLIHFSILEVEAGLRRTPHYYSNYVAMWEGLKIMVMSYLLSILLTGFVLKPMERLSKVLVDGNLKTKRNL